MTAQTIKAQRECLINTQDHRSLYRRDVDRILYSKAYARYFDKTQVVYLVSDDHLTRRGLHVQLVSSFARGIAGVLGLNLDLVEAISLGHDVGHPPFGHEGEGYLSELSQEFGLSLFTHSVQSCRLLSLIEPLDLSFAVYDGFLCHDGGLKDTKLKPVASKDWRQHEEEKQVKLLDPEISLSPATREGCLVKLCDTASYVARDLEDAIRLGVVDRESIPKTILGSTYDDILGNLAKDLIRTSSSDEDFIAISTDISLGLRQLRCFNTEMFYIHPRLKVESAKIKLGYRVLFEYLLKDYRQNNQASYLWHHFAHKKNSSYLEQTLPAQLVVDFIASMTDGYFVRTLQRLFVPEQITL